eukprot:TRINITY_DN3455_c0_g1_i1.p1 TRINITY_DN3455_c0_g1~~TRINITY_DN3455_c0_g1_i1.p1  ORF type:complete len:359 (+),score=172.93 TRINITY_DN3455_c0_g1_i1:56-1132(+)
MTVVRAHTNNLSTVNGMSDKNKKELRGAVGAETWGKLCIGTWAWGGNVATFGPDSVDTEAQEGAFRASVKNGVHFFDTAEIYSKGESERVLGRFLKNYEADRADEKKKEDEDHGDVFVATKYCPLPHHLWQSCLPSCMKSSLERLQLKKVSLFQVHGPAFSVRSVETWAHALVDVFNQGLCDSVGVSNYNSDQVKRTHKVLADAGIQLASNQIEYSLLHRLPEKTGLINKCRELGVTILAYSPLAMGRLTGKYTKDNPPKGNRKFGGCSWEELDALLAVMRRIGEKHKGDDGVARTPAQVAINWVIAKGCIPICGAKNAKQAAENAKALEWQLDDQDVADLDKASLIGESSFWQGSTE